MIFVTSLRPDPSRSGPSLTALGIHLQEQAELAGQLGPLQPRLSAESGCELVLAAYGKWGSDSPAHLLGNFAYVITDPQKRQWFCVRDQLGIRPFYYAWNGERFACASSVPELAALDWVDTTTSEQAVAIYLARGELYDPQLTFFSGIRKLPPGHTMTVDASGCVLQRYWRPEDSPPVRLASTEEYSRTLGELVRTAVEGCLPQRGPVAAHLSGGIDSSAVVALAAPVLAHRRQQCHGYSWMSPPAGGRGSSSPEWTAAAEVARSAGVALSYTSFSAEDMLEILETHNIADGDTVDLWYEFAVREAALKQGCSVILSGWGGDEFASNFGVYAHADAFWNGNPGVVADLFLGWKKGRRRFSGLLKLGIKSLVLPVLPRWAGGRNRFRRIHPYEFLGATRDEFGTWARKTTVQPAGFPLVSVRGQQLAMYNSGHIASRIESWSGSGQKMGIEYRYPLLDRRIVEFALGVPPEVYHQKGFSRYLFRSAVSHCLPASVCWEDLKAEPVRVRELVNVSRRALAMWRRKHGGDEWVSPFIDSAKLNALLDSIERRETTMEASLIIDILTAVKSILVLNLGVPAQAREPNAPSLASV